MEGDISSLWTAAGNQSSCYYSLDSLDVSLFNCANVSQCEIEWPCEVREYWHHIQPFVAFTKGFLSYGTFFFCVLGILLNSLSLYVLISSGLARNGSGIYLVVLAVCDTGNLIFNYAVGVGRGEIAEFNHLFQRSEWLCRFHGVFVEIFQLISAWIVVGFTVERCIAIWYPIILRASKRYRSKVVVLSCSVIFTLFSLSKLFLVGFEKDSVFGYAPCVSQRYVWQGMAYIRVAFQTWIPTVLVFVFNCLMFWKLRRINRNRNRLTAYRENSIQQQRRTLQHTQSFIHRPSPTTPMLIAVSFAYLALVLPLGTVQTVELYWSLKERVEPTEEEPFRTQYIEWMTTKLLLKYIRCFCFGFYQINFTINFFLYCAAGVQFRVHLIMKMSHVWTWIYNAFRFLCGLPAKDSTNGQGNNSTKTLASAVNSMDSISNITSVVPIQNNRNQVENSNIRWKMSMNNNEKGVRSFPELTTESVPSLLVNDFLKVQNKDGEAVELNNLRYRDRLYSDPTPLQRSPNKTVNLTDVNGRRISVIIQGSRF